MEMICPAIFWGTVGLCIIALIAILISAEMQEQEKIAQMSPEERAEYLQSKAEQAQAHREHLEKQSVIAEFGTTNLQMICPHCQAKGSVRTKPVTRKQGISGGKATAAILTGGVSMLATGLSRKDNLTQAHCDNCKCTWVF